MKRKLTDTAVKNAKPQDNGKVKKYTDGGGMYLQVSKTAKYWRYNYTFAGKQNTLALGIYPDISLKEARTLHDEARSLIAKGVDPSIQKKIQKQENKEIAANSFEAIAREWMVSHLSEKSESYRKRVSSYLERDVIPYLGKRPIAEIKPIEVLAVIERIQKRIVRDSHLRVMQSIGQIMRYAIATGRRLEVDPTTSLKGLEQLKPKTLKEHLPAITDPSDIGRLMRAIENYQGNFITKCALKLSALVMLRPNELIRAEWPEVDIENGLWIIEARRMKADSIVKSSNRIEDRHIIPLPDQAVEIFKELLPVTGHSLYVFQSPATRRGIQAPMSDETVTAALGRMGFAGAMTAHGFRGMTSTQLNEMRRPDGSRMWDADAVERQLAHKDKNVIRAAYNRGDYLPERKAMLQYWADHLDKLKEGAEIISIKQAMQ